MLVIWEYKGEIKEKNKGGEDNCETNKIFYCNSSIKGVLGDKREIKKKIKEGKITVKQIKFFTVAVVLKKYRELK